MNDVGYKLTLNNLEIEKVTHYKYLGFIFQDNGNLLQHLDDRMKKAQ